MRQLIVNRILWTWIKDHDDYDCGNTKLHPQTEKSAKNRLKNYLPLCLSITFESKNLSTANIQDFSQNYSITLSDPGL